MKDNENSCDYNIVTIFLSIIVCFFIILYLFGEHKSEEVLEHKNNEGEDKKINGRLLLTKKDEEWVKLDFINKKVDLRVKEEYSC